MTCDVEPIAIFTRTEDDVWMGMFVTDDRDFPFLLAEEDGFGGFDHSTAERIPLNALPGLLRQCNAILGTH